MTTYHEADMLAASAQAPLPWPSPPNPGDLSRRLATRRTELRLSIAQVAERARVTQRYLEYLENFPAQPGAATLRRLAAALHTTPAALLGAGSNRPPGGTLQPPGSLERLSLADCQRLLAPGGVGRIAFPTASGLVVVPVNYVQVPPSIVLRTEAGSVIAGHGDGPVSFQVDHLDQALGQGWSVLVRGQAHRVLQPGEVQKLRRHCNVRPWPAGEHDLFVKIIPERLTGRRVRVQ
jgi:transcriptional regulator with XRE-family HTH domain